MISKPVVFTILFAIFLFTVLVLLGIKYHWTGFSFKPDSAVKELSIPEEKIKPTINVAENNSKPVVEDEVFTPEILNGNSKIDSLVVSMTKQQINQNCHLLMNKMMPSDPNVDLATLNCVVSNFQEVFEDNNYSVNNNQENSNDDQIIELSKQEIDIKEQCIKENMYLEGFSLLQKQLLTGLCISDLSSQ